MSGHLVERSQDFEALAVRDRQLFDYLALEFSPAFNGDRLVTIEPGWSADGMTTDPWLPAVFDPDRAIAA